MLYANAPVTETFGDVTVAAGFASLTPGEIGLCEINTTIPAGVPTGNHVPDDLRGRRLELGADLDGDPLKPDVEGLSAPVPDDRQIAGRRAAI
jgi:hypothetical protein